MRRTFTVTLPAALAAIAFDPTLSISAERPLTPTPAVREAAQAVGTAFLQELVDPARTKYQVGVVIANTQMLTEGAGFLISAKGASPVVEYIAGRDFSSTPGMAARAQIANSETTEFQFTVIRKTINSANCPDLAGAIVDFYSVLETTLSAPVHLAEPPPGPKAVLSDTPDYVVQVALAGWATLSINHMGEWNHPLMWATGRLHEVIRQCSAKTTNSVEQNYSFSWGQARLQKP